MNINNHNTLLLTFLSKNFNCFTEAILNKHDRLERYTVTLLNDIQNLDHPVVIKVHQGFFLLTLR